MDVVAQPEDDACRAIERRLADILDAVHAGDLERLTSYHLDSPKFTKFNDSPPLERQDFATAMAAEAAEFAALDGIRGAFEDVKIDVFGAAAVVTGLFAYEASAGRGPVERAGTHDGGHGGGRRLEDRPRAPVPERS